MGKALAVVGNYLETLEKVGKDGWGKEVQVSVLDQCKESGSGVEGFKGLDACQLVGYVGVWRTGRTSVDAAVGGQVEQAKQVQPKPRPVAAN